MAILRPDQIEALRPLATRLSTQGYSDESKSTDGALTLDEAGLNLFPDASRVHMWQFSTWFGQKRYVVDIVGPKGKTQTVRLKPREIY